MKTKILITGGSGLLAVNWALFTRDSYMVTLLLHHKRISLTGVETDIAPVSSLEACSSLLKKHQPDIVIHTAGLANVEGCDSNPDLAKEVNVNLAKNMAIACSKQAVKMVHISTDHIFSGDHEFSTEDAKTNPLNVYSQTKLLGEQQVLKHCQDALVIRTNFFASGLRYRESFSDTILNSLRNNEPIGLFSDVFFSPILVDELAKRTHQLIESNACGVFNIVSNERLSKYDFGIKLANVFDLDTELIKKISIDDKINLIARPKDMSLSNTKVCQTLNSKIASLSEQLQTLKVQEDQRAIDQVVLDVIPYGKHYIDEEDIQSVVNVLRYGMLTQGPKILEFEKAVAGYVGAKYAVAVSNGTAALHLACLALELGKGDEVITSPNTFVATSNSVLYVGAKPVFVDIDNETLNIDIDKIEQAILESHNIKAIFPVHFGGLPCDMNKIKELADKYNLSIVEDASHALGATYNDGSRVGNCRDSDLTTFSFHPVKGIASGEGGMITTNDKLLFHKLTLLRSHGITKGNFEFPGGSYADGLLSNKEEALENGKLKRWYYEMQHLGYNYRITDIQCALAVSQMDKIDIFIEARRSMAKLYDKAFSGVANITPFQSHGRNNSSHHIYIVNIDFDEIGLSRNQFMNKLADLGVGSQVHYIPVVSQPYYQNIGYKLEEYEKTSKYYQNTLSIPLYFGLNKTEQKFVISSIKKLLIKE